METSESRFVTVPPDDLGFAIEFWSRSTPKDSVQPEKDLMIAVLADAIEDYKKYLAADSPRFRQAQDWLFVDDADRLFSFTSICEILDLSPTRIRRQLLTWRRHGDDCGNRHDMVTRP